MYGKGNDCEKTVGGCLKSRFIKSLLGETTRLQVKFILRLRSG